MRLSHLAMYIFAGLLLLATVPMYRFMLAHGSAPGAADVQAAARSYVRSAPVRVAASYVNASAQGVADGVMAPVQQATERLAVVDHARALGLSPPPQGMRLAPDERCVGDTVVRVSTVKGVPTFTQLTRAGLPVMCPR